MTKQQPKQATYTLATRMADLGWRIAIVLCVPILVGNWLDKGSGHAYGILGFFVAIGLTIIVTVRYVNQYYPGTFGDDQ